MPPSLPSFTNTDYSLCSRVRRLSIYVPLPHFTTSCNCEINTKTVRLSEHGLSKSAFSPLSKKQHGATPLHTQQSCPVELVQQIQGILKARKTWVTSDMGFNYYQPNTVISFSIPLGLHLNYFWKPSLWCLKLFLRLFQTPKLFTHIFNLSKPSVKHHFRYLWSLSFYFAPTRKRVCICEHCD